MNFWEGKIKAFLHYPIDRVIVADEKRRDEILKELNLKFDIEIETPQFLKPVDFLSNPILIHPVSAEIKRYSLRGDEKILNLLLNAQKTVLRKLKVEDAKVTYFRIWRLFKSTLEEELRKHLGDLATELVNLPADASLPDHTIWDHLDATSAIWGAKSKGKVALLMFKITPVQEFIKNARKEVDLWSGSHLLSFLTFQAIKVVVDRFGPDAVIYPHLRGQPFLDKEYFPELLVEEKLKIANIPNKFLAIVNIESLEELKSEIREAIEKTLEEILDKALFNVNQHMRNYYRDQLLNYFKITVEAIKLDGLTDFLSILPENVRKKYEEWLSLQSNLYSLAFEIIEEVVAVESRKFEKIGGLGKEKCSLCGELEIIGNKELWKNVDRRLFKENERLCPVCLVKRFYPEWIKEVWGVNVHFESVSEIALRRKIKGKDVTFHDLINNIQVARNLGVEKYVKEYFKNINEILDRLGLAFNPELFYKENLSDVESISKTLGVSRKEVEAIPNVEVYLSNAKKCVEEIEKVLGDDAEKYYAILIMDGDNMGKLLVGEDMHTIDKYVHPDISIDKKIKRLVTPPIHSAISRSLMHFSIDKVPKIVERHRGELIYAGGDDVLALLPIDSALQCAYEIQETFKRSWDGWNLLPARTMSAGIMIVHYKHPLYDALDRARLLERKAKNLGRNAVAVGRLTRSGSYDEVVFNWSLVAELNGIVDLGVKRLIYDVLKNVNLLPNDEGALKEYIRYELKRHCGSDDLIDRIMDLAKNVRVALTKADYNDKSKLDRINSLILRLIHDKNLSLESIHNVVGVDVYGIVLKKQVRGLFTLLKILIEG